MLFEGDEGMFALELNATSQGLPYDFESVMHFRHDASSHNNYNSTILAKVQNTSSETLGSSNMGTDLDFLHIRLLYCGGKRIFMHENKKVKYLHS